MHVPLISYEACSIRVLFLHPARCTNADAFAVLPYARNVLQERKPRNSASAFIKFLIAMTRKKVEPQLRLNHKISMRISDDYLKKMKGWLEKSNARTISELGRMILFKEEIIWYHKDDSTEALSVELTALRKEINAIGNNINQVTRAFNSSSIPSQKILESLRLLEEFKKANAPLEKVMETLNNFQHGRDSQ